MQFFKSPDLPFGFVFSSYGVSIEIRTNGYELLTEIENLLPPGSRLISRPEPTDFLFSIIWDEKQKRISEFYRNSEPQVCDEDFERALHLIEIALRLTVAEFSPNLVFVHAGAVAFEDSAVIVPGMSRTGKTTLTAALVREGAIYYSDEYAIFDENGVLHPFPKPLSVREPAALGKQIDRSVEAFGGRQGTKPIRVGAIIVTEYKENAHWKPQSLSRGEGVLELLANTVSARTNPRLALKILPRAVENALILKGKRGDAETVSREIKKVLTKNAIFA
ncbi:MAG: hypothetical protein M3209_10300 [Acidobacteriota bacterium]|nr:hypothetical protein [Acidobacteriota bacterium]